MGIWKFLGASWGRLGSLLGAFWELLGAPLLLEVLEAGMELNILFKGFHFVFVGF